MPILLGLMIQKVSHSCEFYFSKYKERGKGKCRHFNCVLHFIVALKGKGFGGDPPRGASFWGQTIIKLSHWAPQSSPLRIIIGFFALLDLSHYEVCHIIMFLAYCIVLFTNKNRDRISRDTVPLRFTSFTSFQDNKLFIYKVQYTVFVSSQISKRYLTIQQNTVSKFNLNKYFLNP